MVVSMQEPPATEHSPKYIVFVDDREVVLHNSPATGGQIMDAAGVSRDIGLIEILADNTQQQVRPDDSFDLQPGHHFKKAPRFKRG